MVGIIALLTSALSLPPLGQLAYWFGVLFVASYLLHYSAQQFAHKFGLAVSLVLTLVLVALLVVAVPTVWLVGLLVMVSSIAV